MEGSVAASDIKIETDAEGRVTNIQEVVEGLKALAAKEGVDVSSVLKAPSNGEPQVKASSGPQQQQMTQEEHWRQVSMAQIAMKRAMEQSLTAIQMATSLFELSKSIPNNLEKHRQMVRDKALMIIETFVAGIPDPRQQQ